MKLRLTLATACLSAAATASPAPAAAAARHARVCAPSVTVLDSPRGLPIGVLYRGDRVQLLKRDGTRAWVRVRSAAPIVGWITRRSLDGC